MQNNDGINESEWDKYFFDLDLVLSAKRACEVQISCDSSGFFRSYSLEDNASQTVSIPFVNFNIDVYGKAIKRTLHITSTDTISVYAANSQFCSMEATLILPTSACGSYYVTQTNTVRRNGYKYKYSPVIFSVLAFEDDTEVEIVPALLTGAGQPGGQPFTITLNKGEVYAVETDERDAGLDFSGSQIRAKGGKKVAVYVGSRSACVPESNLDGDSDNLWDVAYPVSSWGKRFLVVPMKYSYYEVIKITAADNGAVVTKDGETLTLLKPYQSYEFIHDENEGAFTLESSEPVEVYQYMSSNQYKRVDNYRGPSYQYVAPLEQAIEEVTFSTFNTKGISYHYLNFLVKEEDKTSVTLDGKNDEFSFSSVEGAPGYLFTSMQIEKGSHVLKAPHGVVANVYGRGKDISYAYSAGSSMSEINPVEDDEDVCTNGTILFREDFGGNYESDPKVQSVDLPSGVTTLTHQPNFPLATNLGGYNSGRSGCYDIRKTGYHRVNNYGGAYADWYLDFDDHTSPDDEERGYIMQVDMASSATTFYNVQIDGLCANTQLYLSMWGHPVNKYSDAEIQLIVEDLEGHQLTAETAVLSCRLNEWQQAGTYFTVPEKNTSVVYRIFSEGGLNGNDFALDDIEVRLCKPGVEVNKPTDTLCVGSDFTMKAAFVNKGNVYVEPVNYTWFKNEKSGYAADGWEQVATGDSLELKDLKISDNGFYKVIVSSKGVEGVMDKCNSSSDAVELRVATCSPEPTCLPLSSTRGKDFWVAIPRASDAYVRVGESYYMNLILTSSLPCTVKLDADELDYHEEVELSGNVSVTLELPFEKFNITQNDIALKKALHVTSDEDISVYISNYQKCSLDASEILPTTATGSYYIVQTYNSMDNNGNYTFTPTEFVIVGEKDSTKIEVTPTINTTGGQEGGKPYVITLNQGEVYQVRSTKEQEGLDFSGTVVKSLNGEHFSVISGHAAGRVPMETSGDADLMIETLYPVDSWGSKFVIKAEKGGYYDFIRCTAEKDSTKIFVDGELKTTINALETYEFEIQEGDPAIYMESSFPVEVYQYMSGNNWRTHRNDGGPSSMYVAPVDQAIKKVTFVAYDKGTVTKNYLNVVAKTDEVDQVLLDGKGDFATFEAVAYNPDYSVAVLDIEKGSHTLEAPSGVIANVYGLGYSLSYAYLVGSSMNKINGSEVVKDTICVGDEYLFAGKTYNKTGFYTDTVVSAMGCDSLVFLDLTVANCVVCVPTAAHITETICNGAEYVSLTGMHYTKAGVYCDTIQNKAGCDSLVYLSLKVLAAKNEVLLDSAEYGSYYKKYGFEVDFVSWGSHEYSRVEKSVDGCDSVVTLILTGYYDLSSCETVELLTKETICQGESYVFYDRTLTESGRYKETFQVKCTPVEAVDGVRFKDSVIVLDLTVLPNQLVEISDVAYWNESYAGHGFSVEKLEEMGDFKYTATYPAENGCDSTVILTLTVKERPMFIPTAFTPHFEDDMNDHFMPGYEVFIYDRYGNLVCHSEDGWDGTYRGKVATAGIYVYSLIMKDGQVRKGTIEVVKSK